MSEPDVIPTRRAGRRTRMFGCLAVLAPCLFCGGAATAVKAAMNEVFDDFKASGETYSQTLVEARGRGVVAAELDVSRQVLTGAGRVRVADAWLEERALTTHKYVWLPDERRVGGYRLHFTLESSTFPVLLTTDKNGVLTSRSPTASSTSGGTVYYLRLDDAEAAKLLPGGEGLDFNGVRFTPKP